MKWIHAPGALLPVAALLLGMAAVGTYLNGSPGQMVAALVLIGGFLVLLPNLSGRLRREQPDAPFLPVAAWFEVCFDDRGCHLNVSPPGRSAWEQSILWDQIERICYKPEELGISDGLYLFTALRPESFVVPMEAKGGDLFWNEILRRGLFDAKLAIEAACALEGIYCWPQEGNQ